MISGRLLIYILLVCICSFAIPVFAQQESVTKQWSADSNFFDALTSGQVKALFRYSGQYRDSTLHLLQGSSEPDISNEKVQQYSAIGGFIGYETAAWFHTTVGATVYAAAPFGRNPADRRGLGGLYEADGDQDAYAALGELYIKYQNKNHLIRIGRQEMPDYRMVSLSNIRFSRSPIAARFMRTGCLKTWVSISATSGE